MSRSIRRPGGLGRRSAALNENSAAAQQLIVQSEEYNAMGEEPTGWQETCDRANRAAANKSLPKGAKNAWDIADEHFGD